MALMDVKAGQIDLARQDVRKGGADLPAAVPFVEGVVLHEQKRYPEALAQLREAQRLSKDLPGHTLPSLHFYLADILARQGQDKEAEENFLEELKLYPANMTAALKLCALYRVQDRIADLDGVLERYGSENPSAKALGQIADAYRVFGLSDREAAWRARIPAGGP